MLDGLGVTRSRLGANDVKHLIFSSISLRPPRAGCRWYVSDGSPDREWQREGLYVCAMRVSEERKTFPSTCHEESRPREVTSPPV